MSIFELDSKVKAYFEIQAEIEALQAEAEAIKDCIKGRMIETEQEEINGHGWRATWHNTTSSRFDTAAFKKEHKDLYETFCKTSTGTRFTLNPIKA